MISCVIYTVALGIVGGCIYGLLLIRHSRIKSSLLDNQSSPKLTALFATTALLRLAFFAVLCAIVLRYAPQHFILMVGIFIGSLWLIIILTQKGNRSWRGLI